MHNTFWSRFTRRNVTLLSVAICLLAMFVLWPKGQELKVTEPVLVVDETTLAFGERWETSRFRWNVKLKNTSDNPVQVSGLEAGCGCYGFEPAGLTILPHGTETLTLLLDLCHRYPGEVDGTRTWGALFIGNVRQTGSDAPFEATVQGSVRSAILLSERTYSFTGRDRLYQGGALPTRRIGATCFVPVKELRVHCDRSLVSVDVQRDSADHLAPFSISMSPTRQLKVGEITPITIGFQPVLTDGEELPSIEYYLSADLAPNVLLSPGTVVLPTTKLGERLTREVRLESADHTPFSIGDLEIGGDEITLESEKCDQGACTLQLAIHSAQVGPLEKDVRLVVSSSKYGEIPHKLRVIGYVENSTPTGQTSGGVQ